ncbi:dihydrofolate reductase family protein [Marinitoga litoralis]|uniref:dihydrofolate reductase family protein n=1 Tax=Marinitoga litoralis TaxID=570855 RepID=UPI001961F083
MLVLTNRNLKKRNNVKFINKDIIDKVIEYKKLGKNIWIYGGGKLATLFLKENIIDEYIFGIIPIILGKGIPLFVNNTPTINLKLMNYYIENDIVILKYEKYRK